MGFGHSFRLSSTYTSFLITSEGLLGVLLFNIANSKCQIQEVNRNLTQGMSVALHLVELADCSAQRFMNKAARSHHLFPANIQHYPDTCGTAQKSPTIHKQESNHLFHTFSLSLTLLHSWFAPFLSKNGYRIWPWISRILCHYMRVRPVFLCQFALSSVVTLHCYKLCSFCHMFVCWITVGSPSRAGALRCYCNRNNVRNNSCAGREPNRHSAGSLSSAQVPFYRSG